VSEAPPRLSCLGGTFQDYVYPPLSLTAMIEISLSGTLSAEDRDAVEEALSSSGFPWEWEKRPPARPFDAEVIVADPTTEAVLEWVVAALEAVLIKERRVALTFGGGHIQEATYDLGVHGHELVVAAHQDYEGGGTGLRMWDPHSEGWVPSPSQM